MEGVNQKISTRSIRRVKRKKTRNRKTHTHTQNETRKKRNRSERNNELQNETGGELKFIGERIETGI